MFTHCIYSVLNILFFSLLRGSLEKLLQILHARDPSLGVDLKSCHPKQYLLFITKYTLAVWKVDYMSFSFLCMLTAAAMTPSVIVQTVSKASQNLEVIPQNKLKKKKKKKKKLTCPFDCSWKDDLIQSFTFDKYTLSSY